MKCYPFEEKRLLKWEPPFIVQPKYDGFRCRAVPIETGPRGDEYLLLSSEENIIYSVPHISETLSMLGLRTELDGELYSHEVYKRGGFDEISSICSRTVNLHPERFRISFHCFDIVNDQPQMKRLLMLENLKGLSSWLIISPFWLCSDLEDVMRAYDKIIKLGYEGIIVRHKLAPYEKKRSTLVMKFKPKKDDIYEIIGWQEEFSIHGTPKDTLGSLLCNSGDGNTFSVGTGFSADQRIDFWINREKLRGKRVRVAYQHMTSGKRVPRFPVFVEVLDE